jgi:hypothetical protein
MDQNIRRTLAETKWTQLIEECQASPLTIGEFARQHHVGQGSLYNWAKRLGGSLKHHPQAGISFIELSPIHSRSQETELYPIEMGVNHLTIKAEMPWCKLVELLKALA